MKVAFVLFDRVTALDFVGVYDPVTRLRSMSLKSDIKWDLCALSSSIFDDREMEITIPKVAESLAAYDAIIVPGGFGTRRLQHSTKFLAWLKTAEPVPLKISVCTGALLLGACGWLKGRRATTHVAALEELRPYCGEVVRQRIVDEGDIITAAGVSAALDLGLHLVKRWAGDAAAKKVAAQMEYRGSAD